ncbi:hypothetical protein [Accumulibacter sp.]|uniref:hypothetical protein n=1 Tax=Accumulibacter sp. TaxID=2053492 RepID=UPI0028C497D4|nr:hypothetical protein [Accumulibacter sp.]
MRKQIIVLCLALGALAPASAQVSIGIGLPNVSIGINLAMYPAFERIPGYPVYYAPQVNSNFFFYDGLYWVFQGNDWYASSWYNGPWDQVGPERVPLYILRVPVRYYRQPPAYFHGWKQNSPPRWGDHWGNDWSQHRRGWDHWNRQSAPAPAPLPHYQRNYAGDQYPDRERQQALHQQKYRYQPRDPVVRQEYESQRGHPPAAAPQRKMQGEHQGPRPEPRGNEDSSPPRSDQRRAPPTAQEQHAQPQYRGAEYPDRGASPQSSRKSGPPQGNPRPQQTDPRADQHPQQSSQRGNQPSQQANERDQGSAHDRKSTPRGQNNGRGQDSGPDNMDNRGQGQGHGK